MTLVSDKINLYNPPLPSAEIGPAYVHLVLGVAQHHPILLNNYLGPPEWLKAVLDNPPTLDMLQTQAVAIATAVQNGNLPRNRQQRILRNVRALLWLIQNGAYKQIVFSEQMRLLLDLQPESVEQTFFKTAHQVLASNLPESGSSDSLTERWVKWQALYTLSGQQIRPLLIEVLAVLRAAFGPNHPLTTNDIELVEVAGTGPLSYRHGQLKIPRRANFRVDRLYHLATLWGYGGMHSIQGAMARRYAAGEIEAAVLLNLGPDQVIMRGLPLALLPRLKLYETAIASLLPAAELPPVAGQQLQAIHLAEDALQWGEANAALLLHAEGLRPRAVRRRLMAEALLTPASADQLLQELLDPIRAIHVFAPLIGGPLLQAWLAQGPKHTVSTLLTDPPIPSMILSEVHGRTAYS